MFYEEKRPYWAIIYRRNVGASLYPSAILTIWFLDEYVVFVTPTALQLSIFSKILNPEKLDDLAQSSTAESLAIINLLTKVSSSPILLKATLEKQGASEETSRGVSVREAVSLLPEKVRVEDMSLSGKSYGKFIHLDTYSHAGKLLAVSKLLEAIRQVVILSSLLIFLTENLFHGRTPRRNVFLSLITPRR